MSGLKTVGIIGTIGGGLGLLYYFMVYRPAHSISKEPIGETRIILSKVGTVIYMDEAKRIKVTYTTVKGSVLNWASDWYPLGKLNKLFGAIDVKYPVTGTVPQKTTNNLMKIRAREAVDLARGL